MCPVYFADDNGGRNYVIYMCYVCVLQLVTEVVIMYCVFCS